MGILDYGFGWEQEWRGSHIIRSYNIILEGRDYMTGSYDYDIIYN